MTYSREQDLVEAARASLDRQDYATKEQVPLHNRVVDLVACDSSGSLVGIEVKLAKWKVALKQAATNANAFDYVYVCVPGGRYLSRLIAAAAPCGIGVMVCDPCEREVYVVSPARKVVQQWRPNVDLVRRHLREGSDG